MLAGQITERRQIEPINHPEPMAGKSGEILFQPEVACLCGSFHEMVGTVIRSDGTRFHAGQKVLAVSTNHVGIFERFAISENLVIPLDTRRPLEEFFGQLRALF